MESISRVSFFILISVIMLFIKTTSGGFIIENSIASDFDEYQDFQNQADLSFNEGKYKAAYDSYLELAKTNDKYSQYRLAYMYLQGLHVDKQPKEAFAWSAVAAENGQSEYLGLFNLIKGELTDTEIKQSIDHAEVYRKKYGNLAILLSIKSFIEKRDLCKKIRPLSECVNYNPALYKNIIDIIPSKVFFDAEKIDEYIILYSKPLYHYSDIETYD